MRIAKHSTSVCFEVRKTIIFVHRTVADKYTRVGSQEEETFVVTNNVPCVSIVKMWLLVSPSSISHRNVIQDLAGTRAIGNRFK